MLVTICTIVYDPVVLIYPTVYSIAPLQPKILFFIELLRLLILDFDGTPNYSVSYRNLFLYVTQIVAGSWW